ncbi:hypothetical protein [Sphingomonas sp.]|uniref:hypothetical protein n=1 Tax=Sphingomonas sp. TaxID=28214 RepID=UPI001B00E3CB|nr:hypothetical protein [Sphingomonas sp.]MBO9711890.1 hypothetical protein [Sphingomonas sp.]
MRGTSVRTVGAFCALLASYSAQAQTAAQSAAPPCVSADVAKAGLLAAAPAVFHVVEQSCRPMLKDDAFLLSARGKAMIERYEDAGAKAFEQSPDAFAKATQAPGTFTRQSDIEAIIEPMLGSKLGKVDAKTCTFIDRLLGLLEPLPPENFVGIFTLIFEAMGSEKNKTPVAICKPDGN